VIKCADLSLCMYIVLLFYCGSLPGSWSTVVIPCQLLYVYVWYRWESER